MKNLSTLSLFIIGLLSFHCLAAQDNHRLNSLNKVVDTLLQRNEFNGTLLYAVNGKIQYEKSFGNLSLSDKTPIDKSSSFNLASLTKQFIGLLSLKHKNKTTATSYVWSSRIFLLGRKSNRTFGYH